MVVGKLYASEGSPPVRAVFLVEAALEIEIERIEINFLAGEQFNEDYLKLNPQHTVPTYVDQDGSRMWDSHAICAFLVGKYGKDDSLYPKDFTKRAIVDQRLHFDSGNVFAMLRSICFAIVFLGENAIAPRDVKLVNDAYNFLNVFLEGQSWMAGNTMTIADLSLISTVSTLALIIPIDEEYKNLHAWMRQCEKLPYYEEANARGARKLAEVVLSKIQNND